MKDDWALLNEMVDRMERSLEEIKLALGMPTQDRALAKYKIDSRYLPEERPWKRP
jgi:hypothetical protein